MLPSANILVLYFEKGGPIMWPLLVCLLAAVFVVVERTVFWVRLARRSRPAEMETCLAKLEAGQVEEAAALAAAHPDCPHLALADAALRHRTTQPASAMWVKAAEELGETERLGWILSTTITLAPLLGLLGTVTGIMHSFDFLGDAELAAARVSGGIAEALIATAFGLGIAILAVIPYNAFRRRATRFRHRLELDANRIEILLGHLPPSSSSR